MLPPGFVTAGSHRKGRTVTRLATICCASIAALALAAAPAIAATGAPTASTGKASNLAPQSATLAGSVNPHGHPTSFYFDFGRTASYGAKTQTGNAGSGGKAVPVTATLSGLQPNTTYHYKLVAFSPAGTARGSDRTFKTPQIPTTSSISVAPNPIVFGGLMTISGFLAGPDVANKPVALEANAFPFTAGFQQIGNTVLTTAQGGYTFFAPATLTSQLRVIDRAKPSVVSPIWVENVELKPTFSMRQSRSVRGRVKFSGRVTPARVGNVVDIQRRTGRGWKTVGATTTRSKTVAYSAYVRTLRLHKGGSFRALVHTIGGDYVDGPSRTLRVKLR